MAVHIPFWKNSDRLKRRSRKNVDIFQQFSMQVPIVTFQVTRK